MSGFFELLRDYYLRKAIHALQHGAVEQVSARGGNSHHVPSRDGSLWRSKNGVRSGP